MNYQDRVKSVIESSEEIVFFVCKIKVDALQFHELDEKLSESLDQLKLCVLAVEAPDAFEPTLTLTELLVLLKSLYEDFRIFLDDNDIPDVNIAELKSRLDVAIVEAQELLSFKVDGDRQKRIFVLDSISKLSILSLQETDLSQKCTEESLQVVSKQLVQYLTSGDNHLQLAAAARLIVLVKTCDDRKTLSAAGDLSLWMRLLSEGIDVTQNVAARALQGLSWFAENRKPIADAGAIPLLIRLLIKGIYFSVGEGAVSLGNVSDAGAFPPPLLLLQLGPITTKEESAYALSSFAEDTMEHAAGALKNLAIDEENRRTIAAAGAIPLLVQLLTVNAPVVPERAAGALWSLAVQDTENQKSIAATGAIPLLLQLLREGSDGARKEATGALWCLAVNSVNRNSIAATTGIIPLILQLLVEGIDCINALDTNERAKGSPPVKVESEKNLPAARTDIFELAAAILGNLAVDEECSILIGKTGAIPVLVQLLRDARECMEDVRQMAGKALGNLVRREKGKTRS